MHNQMRISEDKRKGHKVIPRSLVLLREMTFILPLFLVVYWGALEGGNMMLTWMTLQTAAREGAMTALQHADGTDSERVARIMDVVSNKASWLKAGTSVVRVSHEPGAAAEGSLQECDPDRAGEKILVHIEMAYKPLTPLLASMWSGIALSGKAAALLKGQGQSAPFTSDPDGEARQKNPWSAIHLY
ncbi:TadE/TadG family type IV pilus assembly protein [Desulfocurvibacter africanus]|uniref:TadE family protein n=1 Tax=Desulfocurvibacter africanus subsp. africanus str. Walvis Bay TaxID=690850 RepID=F3YZV7_DESAF|nr:TadE family protein [Desulfocurvibacter africanus]EGJ50912.1 TadE family protein [Desulfocurvibacter africanus subsp. africanus str. Walvis Bay]